MTDKPKRSGKHRSTIQTPCVYILKIELQPDEIVPVIWRRLEVDGRISLGKLHHFIQAAFGWEDSHLHEFKINDWIYRVPSPEDDFEVLDERKAFLNRLLADKDVFTYVYDFGDNWEHVITVEEIKYDPESDLNGGAFVRDGARQCPPENVGGFLGYHEFLETILVDPHSEDAQELRDWIGGKFDPLEFNLRVPNAAILRIMFNKWGGR